MLFSSSSDQVFNSFVKAEKGYGSHKMEKQAVSLLIAGPALWLLGSIHNSCQIYERADGHVQILQESVNIPFLLGSLLFLVGSLLNWREQSRYAHHGLKLLVSNQHFFYNYQYGCLIPPKKGGFP